MKIWTRILMLLAVGLIGLTFFFPLWRFELWAPQYPEGLAMQVWTYKLSGSVRNINILNHYVGMKPIEAEDFWELAFFPYIMGAFMLVGLIALIANWRHLAIAWGCALLVFGVIGLSDFYYWEYKFGHDLSEDAPIKMEGTAYQPPFIGTATILSITAGSFPDVGGLALSAAVIIGAFVAFSLLLGFGLRKSKNTPLFSSLLITLLSIGTLSGCMSEEKQPLLFGEDACHACKMTIVNQRFGAEVMTKGGKVYKFDSLDCLIPYYRKNQGSIKQIWVVDAFTKGELISVQEASFVNVPGSRSPMGIGVIASKDAEALKDAGKGEAVLSWQAVRELFPGDS